MTTPTPTPSAEPLILALFGPPGSGKGTQAHLLVEEFGFAHLATGDLLRLEIRDKTPLGLQAEAVMKSGGLVSDDLVQRMLSEHMLRALESRRGILLDGFPRTAAQFEFLERFLGEHGHRLDAVFNLEVTMEVLITRLTGRRLCRVCGRVYHVVNMPAKVEGRCDDDSGELYQRADDTRESIEKRMEVYESQTRPVLEAFQQRQVLLGIPANEEARIVHPRLAVQIRRLLARATTVGQ